MPTQFIELFKFPLIELWLVVPNSLAYVEKPANWRYGFLWNKKERFKSGNVHNFQKTWYFI
jgi:hypothetical protein